MIKVVLYIILILSFYNVRCQKNIIHGAVKDSLIGEVLPFANIGIKNTAKGTNTNIDGFFSIEIKANDTLIISYIGYSTLVVPVNRMDSILYLLPQDRLLDGIIVQANTVQTKVKDKVSNSNTKTHILTGGANQYAIYLPNDSNRGGIIESLIFSISPKVKKNGRWESLMRIRVYQNINGYPGGDLLTELINIRVKKGSQYLRVDLSEYSTVFPANGCFIGFDFIGYYDSSEKYVPYSSKDRPIDTYIDCSLDMDSRHITYSKFFGTEWMRITSFSHLGGRMLPIQAKFTAKVLLIE